MTRIKTTLSFLLLVVVASRLSAQWTTTTYTDTIATKSWYFEVGKSSLSNRQAASLDSMYKACSQKADQETTYWSLSASTDTIGSVADNEQLATLRLNSVRELLLANGLTEARIRTQMTLPEERPHERGIAFNRRVTVQLIHGHLVCDEGQPTECFEFTVGRDTSFMSKRGTVVMLKGNAFAMPPGASGPVNICLSEAYSRADIIMQDLQTQSNGVPMISEGMVRIDATVDQHQLALQPGQMVTYLLPTAKPVKGMSTWTGERMEDGRLNFDGGDDVAATFRALAKECEDILEIQLELRRRRGNLDLHCGNLTKGIQAKLINCKECKFFWCKLRIFFKRIFSRNFRRRLSLIRKANRQSSSLEIPIMAAELYSPAELEKLISDDKEVVALRDSLKALDTQLKKLEASPCHQQARQRDSILTALGYNSQIAYLDSLWLGRERRGAETVKFGKQVPPNAMDYYVLSAPNLSWQNIDLLMKYPPEKRRDLLVKNPANPNTRVFLSMNNFTTVLSGKPTSIGYQFTYIPIGEPFRLVAMSMENGNYQYGELAIPSVAKQKAVEPIPMKPISPANLKERLAKLESQ